MNTYMLGLEVGAIAVSAVSLFIGFKCFNGEDWSDAGIKAFFFMLSILSFVSFFILIYIHYVVFHGPKSTLPW